MRLFHTRARYLSFAWFSAVIGGRSCILFSVCIRGLSNTPALSLLRVSFAVETTPSSAAVHRTLAPHVSFVTDGVILYFVFLWGIVPGKRSTQNQRMPSSLSDLVSIARAFTLHHSAIDTIWHGVHGSLLRGRQPSLALLPQRKNHEFFS